MTRPAHPLAVLTGDLVNSTGLGPEKVQRAFAALEGCAETQAAWMDGQSLHFTRHRGDGWQVALAEPKYALRSALAFRAALRALGEEYDTYIGSAQGEVEGEVAPDLNEETRAVFARSGAALEHTKASDGDIRMSMPEDRRLDAVFALADRYCAGWTPAQAGALRPMLVPANAPSYTDLARSLGKSRQAVTKSLASAGYHNIRIALTSLEEDA
ncbi:hypothetical protein [Celeribacter indicus]|uniref:Uncharacterized protein n=1 Tax=Celeribacter indicus TaxID=1208324 RepID=A0A0B5E5L8_9RHOB|nr:hypothetical protein [Celeribacter indicus]AJE47637.1 hypothetical protein P73_2922 [Celeribacter indicus]SDW12762.1 hypothetical protein SAMN05443573_101482 [Celeribacter indicus]